MRGLKIVKNKWWPVKGPKVYWTQNPVAKNNPWMCYTSTMCYVHTRNKQRWHFVSFYKSRCLHVMCNTYITSRWCFFSGLHSRGSSRYSQPSEEILIFPSVSPLTWYEETPSDADVNWTKNRFLEYFQWKHSNILLTIETIQVLIKMSCRGN